MFTELQIPAGRRPLSRSEAQISAAIGILFTIMILFAVFDEYSVGRLSVLLVLIFWVPMLVLHEIGHAVAAKLLGWQVREIVIGFGRDLWRWQIGETVVRVKLAPVEGYVLPVPRSAENIRFKSMLIYAAGPGAELLLLAAMLFVLGWDFVFGNASTVGEVAAQSMAIAILLGAGFNLLPFSSGGGVSDGLGILSSPFMSDESIQLRLSSVELRDVSRKLAAGESAAAVADARRLLLRFPANLVLRDVLAAALATDGQRDAARAYVREQIAESADNPAQQLAWLKRQARLELESAEPSWLVFDLAVQKVLASAPNDLETRSLRGAAMVLRGNHVDGGNLLADIWRSNNGVSEVSDAELLAYLAIAAHRIGDQQAFSRFRSAFEQVNKSQQLTALVARLTG